MKMKFPCINKYLCFKYKKMDTIPPVLQPTENKMTLHDILSLQTVTLSDCVEFIPPVQFGKVVKVYDGDTITVACYLQFVHDEKATCYKFSVRLNGIDTPEIKGKTLGERELAKKARDALSDLIFGKIVELRNVSLEKYGRLLADVYINGLHVNGWMIEKGFAVKYDGGTKTGFGIEE